MDRLILNYLKDYLPPSTATFLQEHVLHPESTIANLTRGATTSLHRAVAITYPVVAPLLDRLTQALYSSPDIVVLGILAVVLLVMLQVLNWMRRVMMFWTRLAARFTLYAGLLGLGAHVYQRGLETSVNDAVRLGQTLLGWASMLKDYWMSEYQRYEAQGQGKYSGYQAGSGR